MLPCNTVNMKENPYKWWKIMMFCEEKITKISVLPK